MIDSILTGKEISPENQERLYAVLDAKRDYAGLARLCAVENLTDAVDVKLGQINAAVVRAAWLRRSGRTTEAVAKMLRSERRVSVIVDLVDQELPAEQYEVLLTRSNSPKVALAILESERPPAGAKVIASRMLADRYENLSWNQRASIDRIWKTSDTAAAAALEKCHELGVALKCVPHSTITKTAQKNLMSLIVREVDDVTKRMAEFGKGTRTGYTHSYHLVNAAGHITEVCNLVASVDWSTDAVARDITLLAAQLAAAVPAERSFDKIRKDLEDLKTRLGDRGGDRISELVASARAATDDDVAGLLQTAETLPSELTETIQMALLSNEGLSLGAQRVVVHASSYGAVRRMVNNGSGFPPATRAALVIESPYYLGIGANALDRAAVEVVLDYLRDAEVPTSVVGTLMNAELTDSEMLALPAKDVYACMRDGRAAETAIERIGALLATELEGEPLNVWQQVDQVGPKFPGSITSMLAMCRATNA